MFMFLGPEKVEKYLVWLVLSQPPKICHINSK